MIIVKINSGDIFLDDKVYFYIEHLKPNRMVTVKRDGANLTINNVESVRYINDMQAIDYTDEGSELEKLRTVANLLEAKVKRYKDALGFFRSMVLRGTDLLELISKKQPEADFAEQMKWIVRDVKKYLGDSDKTLEGLIKPVFEEIGKLDEELRNVTKDGSV